MLICLCSILNFNISREWYLLLIQIKYSCTLIWMYKPNLKLSSHTIITFNKNHVIFSDKYSFLHFVKRFHCANHLSFPHSARGNAPKTCHILTNEFHKTRFCSDKFYSNRKTWPRSEYKVWFSFPGFWLEIRKGVNQRLSTVRWR